MIKDNLQLFRKKNIAANYKMSRLTYVKYSLEMKSEQISNKRELKARCEI